MPSTKYYIKGTLTGSKSYETYTDTLINYELLEYLDEIKALFNEENELAQYIWNNGKRDGLIYGVVTEILVNVKVINGTLYSWTEVTATRKLTEIEKEALLDYLSGQFSDGYGEGLEQQEFATSTEYEEEEYWDEDEQEYYTDEYPVTASCYLHLWQSEGFKLEFVEDEITETPSEPPKPKCKLIGADGNIFNLLGLANRALTRAGLREQAQEMLDRATKAESYDKALQIIMEYVEVE